MSKLGTAFTNLVATGADATAIAALVGCSLACGGVLLAAGIIGLNVAAILTKWERDLDAALRDALHHKLANAERYRGEAAIIPALAAHPAGDAKLRDALFASLGHQDMSIGSAAAKALVALSMREDAQGGGTSRAPETRSVSQSATAEGGPFRAQGDGTSPLLAQAPLRIKQELLTRFESGAVSNSERSALAQGLAPLALRDADLRSVLIARLKADTALNYMSITNATWRVLRVDRLAEPSQQAQLS